MKKIKELEARINILEQRFITMIESIDFYEKCLTFIEIDEETIPEELQEKFKITKRHIINFIIKHMADNTGLVQININNN